MATYLAQASMTGTVKVVSSQVALTAGMSHIHLSLTSSNWATVGAGTVEWGVEYSVNGGTDWILAGGGICQIGILNKGILFPSIGVSRMDKMPGSIWRLYVLPSRTVRLGITGDFDAWQSLS